jgi:hypothetical protein
MTNQGTARPYLLVTGRGGRGPADEAACGLAEACFVRFGLRLVGFKAAQHISRSRGRFYRW